jgi:hypothetical protein
MREGDIAQDTDAVLNTLEMLISNENTNSQNE